MRHSILATMIAGLLIVLTACSGGGSVDIVAGGGTSGTGISQGSVTGFGSLIVNGTRFDTNAAVFTVNGQAASQSDLEIGFIVRVEGDLQNAQANRIDFSDTVRGPIENIVINNPDSVDATLTVLGQTVRTNALTNLSNAVLDPAAPDALNVGDVVAISGFRDADARIIAGFLQRLPDGGEFTTVGTISNLQPSANTFQISSLTVDFSVANLTGLPGGAPANGLLVNVRGSSTGVAALQASVVEPAVGVGAAAGDDVEVEGLVLDDTGAPDTFRIRDLTVVTTAAVFEGGVPTDIQLNRRVEAEGEIDSSGVLQASRVVIKPDANLVRIEAPADAAGDVNTNSVTLLGVAIQIDEHTRMEDKSDADIDSFGIGDVQQGDRIEMRGFLDGAAVIATRLEREDPDEDVVLQGPVEAEGTTTVTILGITVRGIEPGTTFRDENDQSISQQAFHNAVEIDTVVKAKWNLFNNTSEPADELELEN
ncbi:MAG: DUF5666 domain-containing protein [Gammaproteobacteria bacterium]